MVILKRYTLPVVAVAVKIPFPQRLYTVFLVVLTNVCYFYNKRLSQQTKINTNLKLVCYEKQIDFSGNLSVAGWKCTYICGKATGIKPGKSGRSDESFGGKPKLHGKCIASLSHGRLRSSRPQYGQD